MPVELVTPSNTDWQSWFNTLEADMPHGATVDEVEAIKDAVIAALASKGVKLVK